MKSRGEGYLPFGIKLVWWLLLFCLVLAVGWTAAAWLLPGWWHRLTARVPGLEPVFSYASRLDVCLWISAGLAALLFLFSLAALWRLLARRKAGRKREGDRPQAAGHTHAAEPFDVFEIISVGAGYAPAAAAQKSGSLPETKPRPESRDITAVYGDTAEGMADSMFEPPYLYQKLDGTLEEFKRSLEQGEGLRRFLDVVDGREGTLGERDRKRLEKLDQLDPERIFQSIRQNNRLSELRMEEQAQEAGHPYCNRNVVEGPGSP